MHPTPTPGASPTPAGATPTPTSTNTPTATPTPGATPTPVPDLLFADGFESGNTSAWTTVVSDGGDLSVSTASARFGTYGLQAVINDTTSIYVRKVFGGTENHVTARVYLDPNSVTIPSGQSFTVLQLADTTGVSVRVQLKNNAGAYQLVAEAQNDAGVYTTGQYQTINDAWQMVEVEWQTASTAGANDGYVKMWLNDLLVDTLSGLDNDTRNVTKAVIGAAAGVDAGTAGTVYWDGFEARRGSHIGPLSFGPASKGLAAPLRVSLAASFVYDGDGRRVAQTINGVTTYFVGNYYEKQGNTITKYYYAGSQRVAMREGNALYYLLTDHLGSTSLTTDADGNMVSELRYSAWGSVRYTYSSTPTDYTYTGQYSDSYINLLDYGSRRYDPYLNHFTQPDSIVPDPYNSQDWDRYSYARNNPLRYNDPSGHWPTWINSAWSSYMVGWSNFGTAVLILQNPNATSADKAIVGIYAVAWGGAHLALGVGVAGVVCGLTPTCAVAVETALGIGVGVSADGDPTNEIRAVEETGKTLLDAVSKTDARTALKAGMDGLTNGQIQKTLDILGKGKLDSVTVNTLENGIAQVVTKVLGGDGSSFVQYLYKLDPSGKVIELVQRAYNSAGELIHVHDKIQDIIIK
jgi:RHS repeat-associated protein